MKTIKKLLLYVFLVFLMMNTSVATIYAYDNLDEIKKEFLVLYGNDIPQQWGENVTGVRNQIYTKEKIIALTFDACGQGGLSNGYDKELMDYLISENIPATLFVSGGWIDINEKIFNELANNPLFKIESHGYRHKPLSVNGKSAYGVNGTQSIAEVIEEILLNEEKIQNITGKKPKYFRSGTAYYDEVAVKIAKDLGYEVINYNVLGDAGATFSSKQIVKSALKATPGSIILYHMNRPDSQIAEGIKAAVPLLKEKGYHFVSLEDYHYKLAPRTLEEQKKKEIIENLVNSIMNNRSKLQFLKKFPLNLRIIR